MRRLADLRLPQIGEAITEQSILILPVGSIEQHGSHLPLSTDLVIAEAAAGAVVNRAGDELDLWLLPPLCYSKSNEHAWAPGTVWLSARTLLAVIEDLGRSLATLATRKLVLLNGHGGNSSLLNVACRELRSLYGWMTFLLHPMVPPDQGGESDPSEQGMGIHGGRWETSLMMHLAPELVALAGVGSNLPSELAGNAQVRFGGSVTFGWLSDDFGPAGHIGDPTGATAELGSRMFEQTVSTLVAALVEVKEFRLPSRRDTGADPG